MSILKSYKEKQAEIYHKINSHTNQPQDALAMVELNYRIDVLETFKGFAKSAPMGLDLKQLGYHYQLVDAYIKSTLAERQLGPKPDEAGQKAREAALVSVQKVVQDGRKRFASFKPSKPEQYSETVGSYINTVLPVWLAYRDAYVKLQLGEEKKS